MKPAVKQDSSANVKRAKSRRYFVDEEFVRKLEIPDKDLYSGYVLSTLNQPSKLIIEKMEQSVNSGKVQTGKTVKNLETLLPFYQTGCLPSISSSSLKFCIIKILGSSKEKKLLPYLHYFISDIRMSREEEKSLLDLLTEHLRTSQDLTTTTHALRSLERLASSRFVSSRISGEIAGVLTRESTALLERFKTKRLGKRGLKKLIKGRDKLKVEERLLFTTVLETIRRNIPLFRSIYSTIVNDLVLLTRRKEPFIAREVFMVLYEIIADRVSEKGQADLGKDLAGLLEKYPKMGFDRDGLLTQVEKDAKEKKSSPFFKKMNLLDPWSKLYLIRIMAFLVPEMRRTEESQEEYSISQEMDPVARKFLERVIIPNFYADDIQLFLQCVNVVSNNFGVALQEIPEGVPSSKKRGQGQGQSKEILLDYILNRIQFFLEQFKLDQIIVYSVLKSLVGFFRSLNVFYTLFQEHYSKINNQSRLNKFSKLWDYVNKYKTMQEKNLRLISYKISLWDSNVDNLTNTIDRLKNEMECNITWESDQIFDLLNTLFLNSVQTRQRNNGGQVGTGNDPFFDLFVDLCSFVFIEKIAIIESDFDLFLGIIRNVFERSLPEKRRSVFLQMIFKILDETQSQVIVYGLVVFMGNNAAKQFYNVDTRKVVKSKLLSETRKKELTTQDILTRFETFDIHNFAMKAIILRLVKNALFNIPHIRLACISGLGKIALRCQDPIRMCIYECLQYFKKRALGVSSKCANILKVLDECYSLKERFKEIESQASKDDILLFWKQHQVLKEKCCFFVDGGEDYYPLGKQTISILKEGSDLFES